jgi:hypothetical protein
VNRLDAGEGLTRCRLDVRYRPHHRAGINRRGYRETLRPRAPLSTITDPHPQRVRTRAANVRGLRQLCRRHVVVLLRAKRLAIDREMATARSAVPEIVLGRPDYLRRLAPQSRFVAAHAVKQGRLRLKRRRKHWAMARDFDHVRAAGAWTSSPAALGRRPADRLVRSSRDLCYGHWHRWQFGASPVDRVGGTGPAGVRTGRSTFECTNWSRAGRS